MEMEGKPETCRLLGGQGKRRGEREEGGGGGRKEQEKVEKKGEGR